MRKILLILMISFIVVLTACEDKDSNQELPNIEDFDEMELTLGEKFDFLSNLDLDNVYGSGFSINQYLKGNVDYTSYSEYGNDFGEGYSYYINEDSSATLNFDYDTSVFVDIKENLNDFLIYGAIDKLSIDGTTEESSEVRDSLEDTETNTDNYTMEFILDDSLFFVLENDAYFNLNGLMKVTENGDDSLDETFDNIKEKVENIFKLEEYQEFKSSLDEVLDIFGSFDDEMPDLDEFDELSELNDLVKVYKKGNEHIINLSLKTSMVHNYIDLIADQIVFIFNFNDDDFYQFEEMVQNIKDSIKKMDFDFNIYVKNNRFSKVSFDAKLTINNLDLEIDQSDEDRIDFQSLHLSLFVERFGFIVDFNATRPTLPSAGALLEYEVVDEPSYGGIFN